MTKLTRRHLQDWQNTEIADWIKAQKTKPSWQAVCNEMKRRFNIERQANTVMRNAELKAAMSARSKVPSPRTDLGKPTAKKFQRLTAENDQLKVRIAELEQTVAALTERHILYVNFAASRKVTERALLRPLTAIDRNATRLTDD